MRDFELDHLPFRTGTAVRRTRSRSHRTEVIRMIVAGISGGFTGYGAEDLEPMPTHARVAYEHSAMERALAVIMDGNGEDASISIFAAHGRALEPLKTYGFEHHCPPRSIGCSWRPLTACAQEPAPSIGISIRPCGSACSTCGPVD